MKVCSARGCGRLYDGRAPVCDRHRASKPTPARAAGRSYRGTAAWRRMREFIWARDRGVCARCGQEVADGERWDLGHHVAHVEGGLFEADNLRVEHVSCNRGA